MTRRRCNDRALADKRYATRPALEQAAMRNRTIDAEIIRRFSAAMFGIAVDADRFDRAARVHAECHRLLKMEHEEGNCDQEV